MWELDCEESWAPKNWCFWTVVLEKTLGKSLGQQGDPASPERNQSWIFIRRTDAEAETPVLWSPDVKDWLIGKDPDAGKDWRLEEKGTKEDEMVGWHHQLDGHESEQALGVGEGQGSLACCSPWGRKKSDKTGWLNWTEFIRNSHLASGKESACQCRRLEFDPWVGKIPWSRKWKPTPWLGNPMDRGAWWATVHGVTEELDMTKWLNNSNT